MYARCGSLADAHRVFDRMVCHNAVAWTSLLLGYARQGQGELALEIFARIQRRQGCEPDSRCFVAALKACSSCGMREKGREISGKVVKAAALERGMEIHAQACERGYGGDVFVAGCAVDMYVKCGSLADARRAFDRIEEHSVVVWNSLLLGLAELGEADLCLELLEIGGVFEPDEATFVATLKACGALVALEAGRALHGQICRLGFDGDGILGTCLVDFYGRCGSLESAERVFYDVLDARDSVAWTALIAGSSRRGETPKVFSLYEKMVEEGLQPDEVTLVCIITACSHAGLVDQGREFFRAMESRHRIVPVIGHYLCLLDMLGRSNRLEEAVEVVETMPFQATWSTWMTLLGSCRKWKNLIVAKVSFEALLRIDPRDSAPYMLMASLYGSLKMWSEQSKIEALRIKSGAWRKAEEGRSWWTDSSSRVHSFIAGDRTHALIEAIEAKVKMVTWRMKQEGLYVADLDSVARNISDDAKEEVLRGHSERLAMGCALISTAPGSTIRITKNLRVCDDCHRVMEVLSGMEEREIVCRDTARFHVFRDGKCSCGGFW
ncbi:pentatricopeptide repeat-containing protein At4g33170-like [Selaginella moellendorffii]|uniref:pentatricopeptide repeat-containing protein At4g33170-like n=1 Tax=Selaginella moellendorffii TaxID=88036 RepID=UPI000D1C4B0E|nr:pentatricopeptide repeat-containing protein At4g33170-like [Selaginella moellendorffii]|eukprot:XP_024524176.1 pentatricopeptide repeat-containing protein At4g33170-like [Selaginella moellendorffii]